MLTPNRAKIACHCCGHSSVLVKLNAGNRAYYDCPNCETRVQTKSWETTKLWLNAVESGDKPTPTTEAPKQKSEHAIEPLNEPQKAAKSSPIQPTIATKEPSGEKPKKAAWFP